MSDNLNLDRHPFSYVKNMGDIQNLDNPILNYSYYSYKPQSFIDRRIEKQIPFSDMTDEWFTYTLNSIPRDMELAFHSILHTKNEVYHIPMIDMGGRSNELKNIPALDQVKDYWSLEFMIYASGRSYHCYGNKLLSNSEWIKFMASLLLVNIPGKNKVIDNRWVGHRLMAGYSALRWSKNTDHYKKVPASLFE